MNRPDDTPAREVWGMHRVRPWEGGINGSAVLQYLTGFEPRVQVRQVWFAPRLPDGADSMTVRNLRMADVNLTLEVRSVGEETTATVTCEEADAPVVVRISAQPETPSAIALTSHDEIAAGESTENSWDTPQEGEGQRIEIADEPFDFGPADVPQGATVLLTWSAEVAGQVRASEGEVTVIDTRIAWPTGYLRSALLNEDGSPRASRLITDIEGFAGGFKVGDYWTEGQGAELLAEYEAAGGVISGADVPGAGGAPGEGLIN
jgi:hypothetical protein